MVNEIGNRKSITAKSHDVARATYRTTGKGSGLICFNGCEYITVEEMENAVKEIKKVAKFIEENFAAL